MEDNIWHVYPIGDAEEHILDTKWRTIEYGYVDDYGRAQHAVEQRLFTLCKCGAAIQEEENGFIVVHNSFDGREGLEAVAEILK